MSVIRLKITIIKVLSWKKIVADTIRQKYCYRVIENLFQLSCCKCAVAIKIWLSKISGNTGKKGDLTIFQTIVRKGAKKPIIIFIENGKKNLHGIYKFYRKHSHVSYSDRWPQLFD